MHIQAIKTHKITTADRDLFAILDAYIPRLHEGSILAITSKIVAICQGRVVPVGTVDKRTLITQEADYFLPPDHSKYGMTLTITQGLLVPTAGIDESNGNGYYVLWPHSLQDTANAVWAYLRRRFGRERLGVIITDSRTTPLRTGVTGVTLAHSGFRALNNYVGTVDCFGHRLRITQVNVVDAVAAAAVFVMGEGSEQTPLAVISDLPSVQFQEREPSAEELQRLRISQEDDIYGPLLMSVPWHKGHR